MALFDFDMLIAGAGPAGCTLALHLAPTGLQIGIIEKDIFPRQKICGDALSGKVLSVMKRLPGDVFHDFENTVAKIPSSGIRFTAPNHKSIDVPFLRSPAPGQSAPGYVCRRSDFDQFLFDRLKAYPNVSVFEGDAVVSAMVQPGFAMVKTGKHEFRGKVIAAADGVHSIVRKSLHNTHPDKKHYCVGIRGYYENVTGTHPENYIELIFLKELLPGYFWIFPSTGGLVNAGFGVLRSRISEKKVNLVHMLDNIIASHPLIAPRFKNANLTGKAEAHSLPLGTFQMARTGNRFLLLGDAGFLVDPFSGEGIGNAMASGEIAAQILRENFSSNVFSAESLATYDARIRKRFSQEFRTMTVMQYLASYPRLINLVINKSLKNKELGDMLSAMYTNPDIMTKLTRPGFYARLLFR